ncbi:energy transducer TonB [Neptuniibacter caesariensis]|uniref:Protein TonB n=1 Tax=Neptuniibacter caesariensis TaxID=207954 RepID=A0A7U8C0Y9_NEPCE|nr:energy transducer TonB [Neptuniibacter caesariensis]EAR59508.1 TonB-like protein [Oceanospirillum sp. MED92] [Neptuniibacter caesariensis]
MLRLAIITPAGLLLALLLFYALAMVSGIGARVEPGRDLTPDLNFLMVRQESALELRKRELPPEPEDIVPQQQPKMPQLQQQVSAMVNSPMPTVNVPDIDVGVQVALSPSLNNLAVPVPELAFDANPTALTQVPPSYPQRALRRKLEGSVMVEFLVTEAGTVKPGSIKVVKSTPPGVFDKAVIRAIQRWRFKTRTVDGKPVPFKARQELEFKLEN